MTRDDTLAEIERVGVVAVIRADSPDAMTDVCRALVAGGVTACEITMTVPGAIDAIAVTRKALGDDCIVGVGTVLDQDTARGSRTKWTSRKLRPSLRRSLNGAIASPHAVFEESTMMS